MLAVDPDKEWQAKAEERLAEAEHGVQERMKAVADKLPDPDATRERAEELSAQGDRHRERARRLRRGAHGGGEKEAGPPPRERAGGGGNGKAGPAGKCERRVAPGPPGGG